MQYSDHFIHLIMAILLIVGGYQIYFLPQRHTFRKATYFSDKLEQSIPFKAGWVWIYSFLYYPLILSLVFTYDSFQQFNYAVFNFILLLFFQFIFFLLFPVKTPDHWRDVVQGNSYSIQFLKFVHKFDDTGNCFPSMHTSIATLVAFHLQNNLLSYGDITYLFFLFPLLIGISCLYTKQHYIIDLPAGFALGWGVFLLY